jgi:hypothetical protein
VIFPAALAVAQDLKADGKEFITACVVGYEASCRTGEFLGTSHYEVRAVPLVCMTHYVTDLLFHYSPGRNSTLQPRPGSLARPQRLLVS